MYEETANDLNILYEGTFVGYDSDKVVQISYFEQVDCDLVVYYKELDLGLFGPTISLNWEDIKEDFNLQYPKLGAINLDNSVILVKRKMIQDSDSKYRRSLKDKSMMWFDPNSVERNELKIDDHRLVNSNDLVKAISKFLYYPIKMTYSEALFSLLNKKRVGAAFSDEYYLTYNSSISEISLWRNDFIIGKYEKSINKILTSVNLFDEDLKSLGVSIGVKNET